MDCTQVVKFLVAPVLSGHVSPMMNFGQVLGLVPGHVLARPQNVLKIHVLTCFNRGHRTPEQTHWGHDFNSYAVGICTYVVFHGSFHPRVSSLTTLVGEQHTTLKRAIQTHSFKRDTLWVSKGTSVILGTKLLIVNIYEKGKVWRCTFHDTISPRRVSKYLLNKMLHVKNLRVYLKFQHLTLCLFSSQALQGQKTHRVGAAVTDDSYHRGLWSSLAKRGCSVRHT